MKQIFVPMLLIAALPIMTTACKTQKDIEAATGIGQAEVSRTERRDDHLLSTLRAYVEALGGKLEVIAVFEDKQVRLHGV